MSENMSEDGHESANGREGPDGLSPAEYRFAEILSAGGTMKVAAAALGKSERTLRRWRQRPAVRAELRERVAEGLARAKLVLAAGTADAAAALVAMAANAEKPDSARIAAARGVLENAVRLGEMTDLDERLSDLEARLGVRGN